MVYPFEVMANHTKETPGEGEWQFRSRAPIGRLLRRGYIASMPELPDVEGYRRLFDRYAVGKLVVAVVVRDAGVIRGGSSDNFVRRLVGRRFVQVQRVGKWLLAPTDGPTLLIHFGMTGSLQWLGPDDDQHRFDRVLLQVDGGELSIGTSAS